MTEQLEITRAVLLEALADLGVSAIGGEPQPSDVQTATTTDMSRQVVERIPYQVIDFDLLHNLVRLLARPGPIVVTSEPERRRFEWEMELTEEETGEATGRKVPMVTHLLVVRWRHA